LRRFTAKIFVDLPTAVAREFMIRQRLNRVFSHLYTWKEYKNLNEEEKEKAQWKGRPYTYDYSDGTPNFRIKADDLVGSGGIYSELLATCMNKFTFKGFITKLVEMTGPQDNEKARIARGLPNEIDEDIKGVVDTEYSKLALYQYGFSGSDVVKTTDAMVKSVGQSVLSGDWNILNWENFKNVWLNEHKNYETDYNSANTAFDSVPAFIKTKFLFAVSPQITLDLGEPLSEFTVEQKKKVVTWEIDRNTLLGEFGKNGDRITGGAIDDFGSSVNIDNYEKLVHYSQTGQPPTNANC